MSDIITLNGEYVKFYCSENTYMPQILKNTGSMIIVHKSSYDNNYTYNELWLGDNFIATGHGFGNKDIKEVFDLYGNSYEGYNSYLDYKFDELQNAYNSSISHSDDLYTYIVENYISSYGDASNAYIIHDSYSIPLSYLPLFNITPNYNDAEVTYTSAQIKGFNYATNNTGLQNNTNSSEVSEVLAEGLYNKNGIFYLPIGSTLKKLDIYATVSLNDVSKTNSSVFISYISNNIFTENTNPNDFIDYEYEDIYSFENAYITSYETSKDNIHITCELNNIYVKEGLFKIANSYIKYEGTTSYKYYPALSEIGINIYSYENIIPSKNYSFGDIYVEGCLELTAYNAGNNASSNISQAALHPNTSSNNPNYKSSLIIDNCASIYANTGYVYIGIPANYSIKTCKWLKKSNNYTNDISYVNWTGNIYMDSYNISNNTSNDNNTKQYHYVCIDGSNYKYIKYNHYRTYIPESTQLYFELQKNSNIQNIIFSGTNNSNAINCNNINITNNFVQNEEYNTSHWFKPKDLTYIYMQ